MKVQKKDKAKAPKTFSGFWGTVLMTLLITVAFGILIYGMYMLDIVSLFDLSDIWKNNDNVGVIDSDNIYDMLKGESEQSNYTFLYEITPEELTGIITQFTSPENYTFKAEISYTGSKENRAIALEANKTPTIYQIQKYENETIYETVQLANNIITVTDNIRNRASKYYLTDTFSFEAIAGIPSLEQLVEICESIANQSPTVVSDYAISVVSNSEDTMYHIEFVYTDLNQKEEYFIMSETGMIESMYTYIDDTLIYRYVISDFQLS